MADPIQTARIVEAMDGLAQYRRWSPEDNARLLILLSNGLKRREIAAELGRSFRAVKHKLCR